LKILDRYILTTFLKTFFTVFTILIFIFILQSVWQFVKELAGKDLDLIIISKFLAYLLPTLIPLILPLTILLTSIMIFGNFAENYEFAAMKSAGISLHRAMRGVSLFILLLSITTFFFANNVIPWGEYKSRNLRRQIAVQSPKLLITEGQFNKIGENLIIKVDKKYGEKENLLENIVVFLTKNGKNQTVIKAKNGELLSSISENSIQLILNDGNYYEDIITKDLKKKKKSPHVKSYFKRYIKNFDLSVLNKTKVVDEVITHRMLKINELVTTIDSLEYKIKNENNKILDNIYNSYLLHKINKKVKSKKMSKIDSLKFKTKFSNELNIENLNKMGSSKIYNLPLLDLFSNSEKIRIYDEASKKSKNNYKKIENREKQISRKISNLNLHKIALHKKFSLAFSCFILFFIGAPLGAIIRKGGMGLPMVLAIVLFLTYYFIGIFAENSAEKAAIPSLLGAWLSTIILLPLGIVLTKNATSDKGIFNTDGIVLFFTKIWSKITKENKKDSNLI
jgi:lipopolysaccharide export system permease protein